MKSQFLVRPLALAALLAVSGASQAAISVYTSESSFLAAISNWATDTFDDLTPGVGFSGPVTRSAGSISYDISASPNSPVLYGAGSTSDPWLSTNNAKDTITFNNFSAGTYAAGAYFFGSDIAGDFLQKGLVVVKATDADGTVTNFKLKAPTSTYFGFVSDNQLSSLTVRVVSAQNNPVWPTVNDLTLAAVPEPETYALLLSGLGIVGFLARRRREP